MAPGEGVLPSLKQLDLQDNQVSDAGCAALVGAMRSSLMPALLQVYLYCNKDVSHAARGAVDEELQRRVRSCSDITRIL